MAFLPLFDRNPRVFLAYPWVTWGMMAVCIYVFVQQTGSGQATYMDGIFGYGLIPAVLSGEAHLSAELAGAPSLLTPITYQFLHGSWMHLIGNMLFLFVFGDNVEDAMGHLRFLAFYLICGVAAALVHFVAFPGSTVPVVGASGAVSGVLGAYLLLHPRAKVLVPIIIIPLFLPAWLLLIFWFGFQVIGAQGGPEADGIAWWAHIGGFLVGMVLVIFFRRRTVPLFGSGEPPKGLRLRSAAERNRAGQSRNRKTKKRPWG
ncbi:rhomboid family intramembrane serine protease [Aquibaculum arenosum]|uniref:Rhomboid family intramembrane serine protease n=1 Tax=Aquibaculum arenosum TaxID=3032591 RepID=A0ABT5YP83_9PROT|nr:rhomboid family intramembrane serine protease [Fodinicurvata sp. CAU 1616]MDF2096697.1 rhomboid family intramembrane serine protease [Fodinicurvata sp. CAU 1616]